ncbi:hypothetical protein D3C76_697190 [compost metagenome]
MRTAVEVVLVDQVELQLERRADIQAQCVEFLHDATQNLTRVGEERRTVQLVHGHQQLRSRALLPGFIAQGARDRETDAVGVADIQAQAGAFHGGTVDIQGEQRGRQVDAFFVDFDQARTLDALATYHAVHVGNQQIDKLHLRVGLEKFTHLVERDGARGDRRHG